MGAGDDLLARIAALLHAERVQPVQRQLLRGPLLALAGVEPGQAQVQVGVAPGGDEGRVGRVLRGLRCRHQQQRARQAGAAHVQFDRPVATLRQRRTLRLRGRRQARVGMQLVVRGDAQLAPEHEAVQRDCQLRGTAIRQQHQQCVVGAAQQREQRDHPALGAQPGVPLPVAVAQRLHIVGELRLGESHCIRAAQCHVLQIWERGKTGGSEIQVVRHEGED